MIEFSYVPDWRWLAGAGALAAGVLLVSYAFVVGRPAWWVRAGLLTLRWVAVAAVIVCLLDPHRLDEVRRQQPAPMAVLVDCSRSMSVSDVGQTRMAAAKKWIQEELLPPWPAGVTRSSYAFGEVLEPLPEIDTASPTGSVTALAAALEHLLAVPREEPLAGVVLCSDGIDTTQGDALAVARVYRRKGIPIHAVTFGTRQEPKDIVLENLQVKRAVPDQAPTRLGVTLRAPGFAGQSTTVRVRQGSQVVVAQPIKLTGGEQHIELDFTPRQKGFQTYEVIAGPQPGEWLTSNNRRVFGLEVIDPSIRVIYMEGTPQQSDASIPEWKYLKDALQSDPNIKVTVLYQSFSEPGQNQRHVDVDPQTGERIYPVNHSMHGFPRSLAELLKYDVVIHSDIKVQFFSGEQLQNMARFVEQYGGGFVMIGGTSAFGKGGYQLTVIDRIIPVAMRQYADSLKLDFRMQVAPGALDHPLLAIGGSRQESLRIWTEKLPLLHGFNRVDRPKPGAVVLGTTPAYGPATSAAGSAYGQKVVLAAQEVGRGRSMAFTSDTTRTWGEDFETLWGERINPSLALSEANCDSRYYRAFWINAVRWLSAGKVGKTNNAVTIELAQTYSVPNQPTRASVKVRGQDTIEISGAQVSVVVSASGLPSSTNTTRFDPASLAYETDVRPASAGNYTVTAIATLDGRKLGEDQQLLMCEGADQEMADVRARPDVMADLARLSGGKDLTADRENRAAVATLFENVPPESVQYRRTPLWDNPWWMLGIFGLLTLEWVIRRMKGLA